MLQAHDQGCNLFLRGSTNVSQLPGKCDCNLSRQPPGVLTAMSPSRLTAMATSKALYYAEEIHSLRKAEKILRYDDLVDMGEYPQASSSSLSSLSSSLYQR